MTGKLILEDGTVMEGESFGSPKSTSGEVVFSTGMVGYPESLTDPSYTGQILVLTYPIIGNYGVPSKLYWESEKLKISGLVVSNYINTPSHAQSVMTLSTWLRKENVPALQIKDTRFLTQKLRNKGTMLGKIIFSTNVPLYDPGKENLLPKVSTRRLLVHSWQGDSLQNKNFYDPNKENLVAMVSTKKIIKQGRGRKKIILIDCGVKKSIIRSLIKRGVGVIVVPWDYDFLTHNFSFDGLLISNGPGDPKMADKTIEIVRKTLNKKIPILGICLGNQILALAAGGDTYKLKFGHRSSNQPCILEGSRRCFITTQNHGFAVGKIPTGFKEWFRNANDGTNEGLIHEKYPFMSVQFHPEANPGPVDTEWIFDFFLEKIGRK